CGVREGIDQKGLITLYARKLASPGMSEGSETADCTTLNRVFGVWPAKSNPPHIDRPTLENTCAKPVVRLSISGGSTAELMALVPSVGSGSRPPNRPGSMKFNRLT